MRCALPKAIMASTHWVSNWAFWRTMRCDGLVSSTITSKLNLFDSKKEDYKNRSKPIMKKAHHHFAVYTFWDK